MHKGLIGYHFLLPRMLVPGIMSVVGYGSQLMALNDLPAAEAALYCSLTSITTPVLSRLTGKKIPVGAWLAAPISLAGVAVIEMGKAAALGTGSFHIHIGAPQLWALLSTVGFALRSIVVERMHDDHTKPRVTGTEAATGVIAVLAGASTLWAMVDWKLGHWKASLLSRALAEFVNDPIILLPILWLGIVASGLNNLAKLTAFDKVHHRHPSCG